MITWFRLRKRMQSDHDSHCDNSASSAHTNILRGMFTVAAFVFLGKIAGAAKEVIVAWRYGISVEVDLYAYLFNLVSWPISLWFVLLTATLAPLLTASSDAEAREGFCREILGRALLLAILLTPLVGWAMSWVMQSPLSGALSARAQQSQDMLIPMSLLFPLGVLIGLLSVVMLAQGRHANTLLEGIPAVAIAACVAVVGGRGVAALVWGTFIGFALHAIALGMILRGPLLKPRFRAESPLWRSFYAGVGVMTLSQILSGSSVLVDQFFVAALPQGSVASLNYAQRLVALILSFGGTAVARAVIPVFAAEARNDERGLLRLVIKWVWIAFLAGLAAILVCWPTAGWTVATVFERGAFGPTDTEAVSAIYRTGLLQLPFHFATVILFYALTSQKKFIALGGIAALCLLTRVIGNTALVPGFGVAGVMYSTCATYAVMMILYLAALRKSDAVR